MSATVACSSRWGTRRVKLPPEPVSPGVHVGGEYEAAVALGDRADAVGRFLQLVVRGRDREFDRALDAARVGGRGRGGRGRGEIAGSTGQPLRLLLDRGDGPVVGRSPSPPPIEEIATTATDDQHGRGRERGHPEARQREAAARVRLRRSPPPSGAPSPWRTAGRLGGVGPQRKRELLKLALARVGGGRSALGERGLDAIEVRLRPGHCRPS